MQLSKLAKLLSLDEGERATKFRFERDRDRFVVGRGMLRLLLGRYLDRPPAELQICYGPYGKPSLAEDVGPLHFSVAHSRQLALYAFAQQRDVGVDLEYLRTMPDAGRLAKRFFSRSEYHAWRALPAHLQTAGFFACWTRKEAFVKALGEGLSYPLDKFSVSVHPFEPARLLTIEGRASPADDWTLWSLDLSPDFAAAIAIRGSGWQASFWDFSWS